MKTRRQMLAGVLGASLMMTSSCTSTTRWLWDETNPQERVWVAASGVGEQQLAEKQIPYSKWKDGYLIPKSKVKKLGDYTIRTLATPITVTIDAATTVVVVGVVLVSLGYYQP